MRRTLEVMTMVVAFLGFNGPAIACLMTFEDKAAWTAFVVGLSRLDDSESFAGERTKFRCLPSQLNGIGVFAGTSFITPTKRNIINLPPPVRSELEGINWTVSLAGNIDGANRDNTTVNFLSDIQLTPWETNNVGLTGSESLFELFDATGPLLETFTQTPEKSVSFIGFALDGDGGPTSGIEIFQSGGSKDILRVDSIDIVTQIPEPPITALLATGLLSLGVVRKRRVSQTKH